jgi:hypothetical protein
MLSPATPTRDEPLSGTSRDGRFEKQGAPPAIHLVETLAILNCVGPPSLRRRLRVARRELIGAASDLERVGLVDLEDAEAERLLAKGPCRLAG